jgi:hypothetical protein
MHGCHLPPSMLYFFSSTIEIIFFLLATYPLVALAALDTRGSRPLRRRCEKADMNVRRAFLPIAQALLEPNVSENLDSTDNLVAFLVFVRTGVEEGLQSWSCSPRSSPSLATSRSES